MDYTGKLINKNPPQPTQASASGVWTLDEAAAAVKNNSWPIPGVPNPISKSLRFNSADNAYLNRTPSSAGNRRTWTWSGWFKKTKNVDDYPPLFNAGQSAPDVVLRFDGGGTYPDTLNAILENGGGGNSLLSTTQVFRDPSAWYHIVWAVDTTQATANNRQRLYINGVEVTAFNTRTNPSQNFDTQVNNTVEHRIGAQRYASYYNGYMTEVNFIDGQQLTPSSFGQTNANTGVWEPKPYTGTYGGNGFYLNFKDSATTTALGYDYSGNSNNWTPNNFSVTAGAGNDSLVDVPTQWIGYNTSGDTGGIWRGNYCTWNPLDTLAAAVANYTNGNLNTAYTSANYTGRATMAVTTGKWYWEITVTTTGNPIGIATAAAATNQYPGQNASSWGYYENGNKYTNGSASAYGNSYTTGDVIGVAFDADGGNLYFYKNGTVQNSGTAAFTSLTSGPYFPAIGNGVYVANFGQRPFAYTPPAGFLSLCTTNLPTPTIGATSTTQAGKYFNTVLYTGTGSSLSVTGVGFQPDFVWIKERAGAADHGLYDAVRGVQKQLESNTTDAETTETTGLTAFNSDGFTVGALAQLNTNTDTYASWNWNGGGSNATNTSGSITSTVRANTTAGFSIVTYTGTGANATVGHGLGVAPQMIIIKNRTGSGVSSGWGVYHVGIGATKYLALEQTAAAGTSSALWQDTAPTSTVFSLGTEQWVNTNGGSQLAYCFAPVAGYSAFGSYTGNGSTDGPFVYTGFRPAWVMIKRTNDTSSWNIVDVKRNTYNVMNSYLSANTSSAEDSTYSLIDSLSNGFKVRQSLDFINQNTGTFIYAAFAEFPLKYALAR